MKRDERKLALIFLFLASSYIITFIFKPLAETIYKVFYQVDSLGHPLKFVSWNNFQVILSDSNFLKAIGNSWVYTLLTVPISKVTGLCLAILARKKTATSFIYEAMFALPIAVAIPAICMIFSLMYSPNIGLINQVLDSKIQWLKDPNLSMLSLSVIGIWISTGYAFIYLLPAIRNIPSSILDAAKIDSVGFFGRIRYIYLPYLSPTFFYLLLMDIPNGLMIMSIPNILTRGGPNDSTLTIMLYIYKQISAIGNQSLANAATLLTIFMMAITILVMLKLEKRVVFYDD